MKQTWSLGGGALAVGALVLSRRTRGYDRIAPELRSPRWWLRSPAITPLLLPLVRRRAKPTKPVAGVTLTEHVTRSADGTAITVYRYRPDTLRREGGAMLYTHGGGMISESAAGYHERVSAYARDLGIVIASTEYRRAPEHPFPTPLDDVHAGYRWLLGQVPDLGLDPRRIAIGGGSAGGGLTAGLAQRLRDGGEAMPAFQLLVYPMLDDRTTLRPPVEDRGQLVWTPGSNRFGWTSYLGRPPRRDDAPAYAVPARCENLAGLPPAWIGCGTLDLFYDEDRAYAERLRVAGVPCMFDSVDGAFHGFEIFCADTRIARDFRDRALDAVRRGLGLAA